jgi:hypothetical protein
MRVKEEYGNIIKIVVLIGLVLTVINLLTLPVGATANMDNVIQSGKNCEPIARYFAEKYNTELYILVPLQDNGAAIMGDYSFHMINSKVIDGNRYYFEFNGISGNSIFTNEQHVMDWYKNSRNKNIEIYNANDIPYTVRWN